MVELYGICEISQWSHLADLIHSLAIGWRCLVELQRNRTVAREQAFSCSSQVKSAGQSWQGSRVVVYQ